MTDIGLIPIIRAPNISLLSPGELFNQLSTQEQLYAHHSAQAAWSGTGIIFQQVSPESQAIFDCILELYRVRVRDWTGDWTKIANRYKVAMADVESFLNYAAMFLGNIENYFYEKGKGDQKFVPAVTIDFLRPDCLVLAASN